MKRSTRFFAVVVALGIQTALSCSSTSSETSDSQTHFFDPCGGAGDCEEGLTCLCGRCTASCQEGACLSDLSAECLPETSDAVEALCGQAMSTSLCFPACESAAQCPGDMQCEAGACVPASNPPDAGGPEEGGHTPEGGMCAGLDEATCRSTSGCEVAFGQTTPNGPTVYAGCRFPVVPGCGPGFTSARAPDGTCFVFGDTCIPDGWDSDGTLCGDFCAEPDTAEWCMQSPGCAPLFGSSVVETDVYGGCIAAGNGCGELSTCARGPGAPCLRFPTTCVPLGWEVVACDSAGCPNAPPTATLPNCDLETVVDYVASGSTLEDCGTVDLSSATAEVTAVADCIAAALAASRPHRAIWDQQGTDSIGGRASLGVPSEEQMGIYDFWHDRNYVYGFAPNGAFTQWRLCRSASVRDACTPEERICVDCEPDSTIFCECRSDGQQGPGEVYCSE